MCGPNSKSFAAESETVHLSETSKFTFSVNTLKTLGYRLSYYETSHTIIVITLILNDSFFDSP